MTQKKFFTQINLIIFLTAIILFLLLFLRPHWEFSGDNNGYYMYLRSLYFDYDLKFDNELIRYDTLYGTNLSQTAITSIGKLGNPFAVGSSIFWLPFFLVARVLDWGINSSSHIMPGYESVYSFF